MRFGVRECVDVVFKAKSTRSIGSKVFYKDEPVLLFDTLTTSTLEGQGSTVYVQGGRGNARLMAWDGERTVTFTMTNALLNKESISILTSAQLIEAGTKTGRSADKNQKPLYIHTTTRATVSKLISDSNKKTIGFEVELPELPYVDENKKDHDFIYVMLVDEDGDFKSEPYIATVLKENKGTTEEPDMQPVVRNGKYVITVDAIEANRDYKYDPTVKGFGYDIANVTTSTAVFVDYYVKKTSGAFQVEIAPDAFGGNFYIEGSTLFRDQASGRDLPAEIVIPNGKIQSNFTFTMSGSGDPSSFDFTLDAFPDYTRWDPSKKVFADIQVIYAEGSADETLYRRLYTESNDTIKEDGSVVRESEMKSWDGKITYSNEGKEITEENG
jgi:hypothetical protein